MKKEYPLKDKDYDLVSLSIIIFKELHTLTSILKTLRMKMIRKWMSFSRKPTNSIVSWQNGQKSCLPTDLNREGRKTAGI